MSQLMDYAEFLASEIGPRPASTPQEEETALFITEQFQKESGFPAVIEEFTSTSNFTETRAVCCLITFVVTIIAMFVSAFSIPAFILAAAAAVIYTLEAFDRPVVSRMLARGASQNVVAKYKPNPEGSEQAVGRGRAHKILLVAHYDSGKVVPGIVRKVESLGLPLGMASAVAMIADALLLFFHIFLAGASGFGGLLMGLLMVICLVIIALPVIKAIILRLAPYNEGANNNATGTAALLEVARRISRGSLSEADLAEMGQDVVLHGEEAAWASGFIPEGVEFVYEAELPREPQIIPPADEDRILSAKAAIAALTGQPVENKVYGSVAENLVNARIEGDYPADAYVEDDYSIEEYAPEQPEQGYDSVYDEPPANKGDFQAPVNGVAEFDVPAPEAEIPSSMGTFENAPNWFVAAQQKAKRTESDESSIHRSAYVEAIEAAEREMAERERARQEELRAQEQAEREERERIAREQALAAQAAAEQAREEARRAAMEKADAQRTVLQEPEDDEVEAEGFEELVDQDVPIEADGEPVSDEGVDNAPARKRPDFSMPLTPVPDPAQSTVQDQMYEDRFPVIERDSAGQRVPMEKKTADEPVEEFSEAITDEEFDYDEDVPVRTTRRRIESLPMIESEETKKKVPETESPSRSGVFRKLRAEIPSLSGIIRMQRAGRDVSETAQREHQKKVSRIPNISTNSASTENAPARSVASRRAGKDNDLSGTPQEWLNVDEDFDARSVGRERGSWESFRNENDGSAGNGKWEGGAFSRINLGHVSTRSGENEEADEPDTLVETEEQKELTGEIEQIYHFRNPFYDTEIWFVAIGSDTANHDGIKAFLAEHESELRGALLIEVESLGAGRLCMASEEGLFQTVQTSSRMKRYTRNATTATGVTLGDMRLTSSDSISSIAQRAGLQSMHLAGVEKGEIALKGSADDVIENVDEEILEENVDYLMELLKLGKTVSPIH